jgi:hypothetical protein
MKVLLIKGGSTAADVLTLPEAGGDFFERLSDGAAYEGKGVFAELPDEQVFAVADKAAQQEGRWISLRDIKRDLKFIDKNGADYELGTEVAIKETGSGSQLVPDSRRIDRAGKLAKGDKVAIGPNVKPKYLMNMHGEVVGINGTTVSVKVEESDLDRVKRSGGKPYANPIRFPRTVVEKV